MSRVESWQVEDQPLPRIEFGGLLLDEEEYDQAMEVITDSVAERVRQKGPTRRYFSFRSYTQRPFHKKLSAAGGGINLVNRYNHSWHTSRMPIESPVDYDEEDLAMEPTISSTEEGLITQYENAKIEFNIDELTGGKLAELNFETAA